MTNGIYILTSNGVYDQFVALLNSIDANYSQEIPICLIPYNDEIDLIEREVVTRKNIFWFKNRESIQKWESFFTELHNLYNHYPYEGLASKKTLTLNTYRKCCAFDGPFERFIYIDCDTIVFQPLDHIFKKLDEYDCVSHDFQRKTSIRKNEVTRFFEIFQGVYKSEEELANQFHCGGFWAYKKGAISDNNLEYFRQELAKGDIKIFSSTFFDDTPVLNYMNLKKGGKLYNFTVDETSQYNTGSCITSLHFEEKDHILYDRGKKLTYLHYMGIQNERLRHLCWWRKMKLPENDTLFYFADKLFKWQLRGIPYKDIFLYYRYLK